MRGRIGVAEVKGGREQIIITEIPYNVNRAELVKRIADLTNHLQTHSKDYSSRRGLLMMVGQRRKLLDYLHTTDVTRYQSITKKLKLRR